MRKLALISPALLLSVLFAGKADTCTKIYRFPDLVDKAAVIAEGRVTVTQGSSVLAVDKLVKGTAPNRITLIARESGGISPAKFLDGETVIVFLEPPDNTDNAALVGYSSQGRWPQPKNSACYQRTYREATLDRLERAIMMVKQAIIEKDSEEYASGIIAMLKSDDEVLQLAGLELAMSDVLSSKASRYSQIAAFALDLLDSRNPDVRAQAIQLVGFAPSTIAAPALIPLLSDTDKSCRMLARVALRGVWTDAKIEEPEVVRWLDTPEAQNAARTECERLWQERVAVRLDIELPRLRASLGSSSELEKESALIYLRRLGLSQ